MTVALAATALVRRHSTTSGPAPPVVPTTVDGSFGVLGPTADATGQHEHCGAPPVLTAPQARQRLETTTDRFPFYRDPIDDRGHVLYRRYDGRFGLLLAA